MSGSTRGRAAAIGCAAALASAAAFIPAPALATRGSAGHHHNSSAHSVAASKAEVASLQRQVRRAAGQLGRARGRLARLNTSAEVAFEAYDGAQVKLQQAQQAAGTAAAVLNSATKQVGASRRSLADFARAAYETGGLSTLEAFLAPGGTRALQQRVGDIQVISNAQRTTVQRFTAAQVYRTAVSGQAQAVAAKARQDAVVAAHAKTMAQLALRSQDKVLASLRTTREHLDSLLSDAQAHASKLQRERLAALARARAAAAAGPPASAGGPSPFAGATGSLSGTISAATGLAAVHVAEAQIGKPYVWGGAGPDDFDCSGLVMWSYDQVGVHLDHWTGDQWNEGAHISQADLRPGDLVFFAYNTSDPSTIHHVGMYIGNGEMVEAPYTGADVRISSAERPDYIGAVRPYQR